jgi:hypothetical protein
MAKIRKQYFAGRGRSPAEWVSPEYNKNWQEGSKCFKDLTESTTPCKITTKSAPPPGEGRRRRPKPRRLRPRGGRVERRRPAPETEEATA